MKKEAKKSAFMVLRFRREEQETKATEEEVADKEINNITSDYAICKKGYEDKKMTWEAEIGGHSLRPAWAKN
jgi:hypothetical protein